MSGDWNNAAPSENRRGGIELQIGNVLDQEIPLRIWLTRDREEKQSREVSLGTQNRE